MNLIFNFAREIPQNGIIFPVKVYRSMPQNTVAAPHVANVTNFDTVVSRRR
ncbi:hypothetical protein SH528x_005018 [Novipirellula sp. SH528]|uniref:hypothetical protein n=1 Tax=Novipirellula sp. SH528 TaxID=3454466 RepID=UPI003F9FD775